MIVSTFKENVQYGVNLDVTSYTDGKRETHNPPGRAWPFTVWDFYEVRLQQTFRKLELLTLYAYYWVDS